MEDGFAYFIVSLYSVRSRVFKMEVCLKEIFDGFLHDVVLFNHELFYLLYLRSFVDSRPFFNQGSVDPWSPV